MTDKKGVYEVECYNADHPDYHGYGQVEKGFCDWSVDKLWFFGGGCQVFSGWLWGGLVIMVFWEMTGVLLMSS